MTTDDARHEELAQQISRVEERLDAAVQKLREVEKEVLAIQTVRNQDMREIKKMIEESSQKTMDTRLLKDVNRVITLLDGDEKYGITGMRHDVADLVKLRDRILWIAIGLIIASGGIGALLGEAVKAAITGQP